MLRRPLGAFLRSRVVFLLWPLFVWSWIFFFFKSASGSLVNNPVPWSEFPVLPLPPREEFWFFWALFLVQVVLAVILRPVVRNERWRTMGWLAAWAVVVGLSLWRPGVGLWGAWLVGAYDHASYFILGVLLSRLMLGQGLRVPLPASLAAFLLFEGCVLVLPAFPGRSLLIGTGAVLLRPCTVLGPGLAVLGAGVDLVPYQVAGMAEVYRTFCARIRPGRGAGPVGAGRAGERRPLGRGGPPDARGERGSGHAKTLRSAADRRPHPGAAGLLRHDPDAGRLVRARLAGELAALRAAPMMLGAYRDEVAAGDGQPGLHDDAAVTDYPAYRRLVLDLVRQEAARAARKPTPGGWPGSRAINLTFVTLP